MKLKGKVIQIILNNKLNSYFSDSLIEAILTENPNNDIIVLGNPEYPKGLKGYFMSFKSNKPESTFAISMEAKGINLGDTIEVDTNPLYERVREFYVKVKR